MIIPASWRNLAGTLPVQLAHLAEHLEQLDHLPCSGILKSVALARQAEANAIRITPAMQKVMNAITAHPDGVTRYDLEAILKQRYSTFKSAIHALMKAKRVTSTPQGGRRPAIYTPANCNA